MTDFYKLLNTVIGGDFTPEQLSKLQNVLTEKQQAKKKKATKVKELSPEEKELFAKCTHNRSEVLCCPHCGSVSVIKYGRHQNGRQKYRCKDCKKIFGDTNGTFLYRSKLNLEQWHRFIHLTMCNLSLPVIKKTMGINIATAWYNRHKLCSLIQQIEAEQDNFPTIVEGDEYYTPLSFKGMQDKDFFIEVLGRMPNHHRNREQRYDYVEQAGYDLTEVADLQGLERRFDELTPEEKQQGIQPSASKLSALLNSMDSQKAVSVLLNLDKQQKKKRGISNQQVCVLTGADKLGNTYLSPSCIGKIEPKHIEQQWKDKFTDESILVTDSLRAYKTFANNNKIHLRQIPPGKHTSGVFNLGKVNSYHSRLTDFLKIYDEVASKYLDHYLSLFRWMDKYMGKDINKGVALLMDMLTKGATLTHSRKLRFKPMPFDTKGIIAAEYPYSAV